MPQRLYCPACGVKLYYDGRYPLTSARHLCSTCRRQGRIGVRQWLAEHGTTPEQRAELAAKLGCEPRTIRRTMEGIITIRPLLREGVLRLMDAERTLSAESLGDRRPSRGDQE